MSVWYGGLIFAMTVWGFFFKAQVFWLFIAFSAVYFGFSIYYQTRFPNSLERKIQIASFSDSGDLTLYITQEVDLTNADDFISQFNALNPTQKITYTHFGLASVAYGLKQAQLNGKMCFGAYAPDSHIDGSVIVDVNGAGVDVILVSHLEKRTLPGVSRYINHRVKLSKEQKLKQTNLQNKIISYFPSYVAKMIMKIGLFFLSDIGVKCPPLTPKQSPRVHLVISNVSASNIQHVYTAFPAITKIEIIAVMSAPSLKPVVVDGKIEPRKIMALNYVLASRFIDIEQSSRLMPKIKEYWENAANYVHYLKEYSDGSNK